MVRKQLSGLTLRRGIWQIDKRIKGYGRLYESSGTSDRAEAEAYLIQRLAEIASGVSPQWIQAERIWRAAATRYLQEFAEQPSIWLTATYLKQLDPFIGDLPLSHIDDTTLAPYVEQRRKSKIGNRTINIALQRVVRILNLCARKWRDEQRKPWLASVPMVTMLDERRTARQPYPLTFAEQDFLLQALPAHLRAMALFKLNTGTREQEVCQLRWEWEIKVPELETSVFLIPADFGGRTGRGGVKNGEDRLVILNDIAKQVIDERRGKNADYVFDYRGRPIQRMNDSGWRLARKRAAAALQEAGKAVHEDLAKVRVHDLKHTFGRRLRAAAVSFEDRQALLGHKTGSVTTHYSAAELGSLIKAANAVCGQGPDGPSLMVLVRRRPTKLTPKLTQRK